MRVYQYADTAVEVWVGGAPPWINWPSPDHFRSGSAAVACAKTKSVSCHRAE